jgi:hypothetical protein
MKSRWINLIWLIVLSVLSFVVDFFIFKSGVVASIIIVAIVSMGYLGMTLFIIEEDLQKIKKKLNIE